MVKQKEQFRNGNAPKYFNETRLTHAWLADLRQKHQDAKKTLSKRKGLVIESYRQDARDPELQQQLMSEIKEEYERRNIKYAWQVLNTDETPFDVTVTVKYTIGDPEQRLVAPSLRICLGCDRFLAVIILLILGFKHHITVVSLTCASGKLVCVVILITGDPKKQVPKELYEHLPDTLVLYTANAFEQSELQLYANMHA